MENENVYQNREFLESRGSDSRASGSVLSNIKEYSRSKLDAFKRAITKNFNTKLNLLTTIACILTLVIMLVMIFFTGFVNDKPLYFSLIQYISIGIFSVLLISYYCLAYFWLRNKQYNN